MNSLEANEQKQYAQLASLLLIKPFEDSGLIRQEPT